MPFHSVKPPRVSGNVSVALPLIFSSARFGKLFANWYFADRYCLRRLAKPDKVAPRPRVETPALTHQNERQSTASPSDD
jgi:hypothetical protein